MKYRHIKYAAAGLMACVINSSVWADDNSVSIDNMRFYMGIQGAKGPAQNDVGYKSGGFSGFN